MKLFYTPNSPYARIARVTALELGLCDRIAMQKVTVRDPNSELLNYNPTGKVPTLATDDGFILSDTRIICVYLNQFNPEIKLVADISDGFLQQLEGIVSGFIDGIAVWVRELRRSPSEQSPGIIELERSRALRILDYFEKISDQLDQTPKLAHITLASALGFGN
ncbi:glutathione S-transferase family protein [Nostoc sphaeroides]|uniref:Glutathione S-transferase n=1 Tax=Nostoc sphaeroides CCNUC1 TaxID=2653204 RepID=A0A5P8WBM8_9NOSO|nr:glutathione S-transferase N-terminal domain-containing protein [Nostoc sphaeroides]MCC5632096.1 glutathione S-transferase N-terminal domain-containing protein [Nostoc sphaeroides CHAB 2801]QFS50014.1 glutathione S-transferase [Nostoc sphaeroides CCNUC1]